MTAKYETQVSSIGAEAKSFAEHGILVLFGPSAPEELHDFAIITEESPLHRPVEVGDVVFIDGTELAVTGVGDRANDNIAELGHVVLKFNGLAEVELPGEISVTERSAPEVNPGSIIKIEGTI